MNTHAQAEPLEFIAWLITALIIIALVIILNTATQPLQAKNMLANAAYAHLLPELENTQTRDGKTIGELIGRNDARAGEEINSFMTTVLPNKEYAVYLEQKNALNLIAGKPVNHASIILHGILPLPDKTAATLVLQVQT